MADRVNENAAWAHDVVPHPGSGESKPLDYMVRYHYAQALGWHGSLAWSPEHVQWGPHQGIALAKYLGHAHLGLLHDALAQGLTGESAATWASEQHQPDVMTVVRARAVAYGLDPDTIRRYGTRDCEHDNVRTSRSLPPRSTCLDCGAVVARRWVKVGRDD